MPLFETGDLTEYFAYLREFYRYQYEYYKRSEEPKEETINGLEKLAFEDGYIEKVYNDILFPPERIDTVTFHYNSSLPYKQCVKILNKFYDEMIKKFKKKSPYIGKDKIHILDGYVKNNDNDILNSEKLFESWKRYLEVYDLHKNGDTCTIIAKKQGRHNKKDTSNSVHKIEIDIAKAVELIESASEGRFPYKKDKIESCANMLELIEFSEDKKPRNCKFSCMALFDLS